MECIISLFKNSKLSLRHRKNIAFHSTERQIPSINQPHFCTFSVSKLLNSPDFLLADHLTRSRHVEIVKSIVRVYLDGNFVTANRETESWKLWASRDRRLPTLCSIKVRFLAE